MNIAGCTWHIAPAAGSRSRDLSTALGISPVVAQILINRGLTTAAAAQLFLTGEGATLHDARLLTGMDQAVARIERAVKSGEHITVYGDYDVDGITSTALVVKVLRHLGAHVDYYLPDRLTEGYGLHEQALTRLRQQGTQLVVTVDCGINAVAEVAAAARQGLDIIITDHHQPSPLLPPAVAVINPRLPACQYPDKNLAGVGVAYKLCAACVAAFGASHLQNELAALLDLVSVGTIADVVPLMGENRLLVRAGLKTLAETSQPGLQALQEVCGLRGTADADDVAYMLAPRLNAAGRMATAIHGVKLLLAETREEALPLAAALNRLNTVRQAVEKTIMESAITQLADGRYARDQVLVLAGDGWHRGVIGIVASRLVERFYRPVVMISREGGIGHGSCRSIPGFDIFQALTASAALLQRFGGHVQAAGLTVAADNIAPLRERLNALASGALRAEDLVPRLEVDALVNLSEVTAPLVEQLTQLAPFGAANPAPVLACSGAQLVDAKPVGKDGKHLRLRLRQGETEVAGIAWRRGDLAATLVPSRNVDVAFRPVFDTWQGQRRVQLVVCDVRQAVAPVVSREQIVVTSPALPGFFLHDRRQCPSRYAYIRSFLSTDVRAAVIVNTPGQAVQLGAHLTGRSVAPTDVLICHEDMTPEECRAVQRQWQGPAARTLVTTAAVVANAEKPVGQHFFWYFLPCRQDLFLRFLTAGQRRSAPGHLHILFNTGDLVLNRALWAAQAPDRAAVAAVYLVLKRRRNANNEINLTKEDICALVPKLFGKSLPLAAVNTALAILSEVGLVRRHSAPGAGFVILPAANKISLTASSLYRTGQQARRRFEQFAAASLSLPAGQLVRHWREWCGGERKGIGGL